MPDKKKNSPKLPPVVITDRSDGTVHIAVVNSGDTEETARLLLDAVDHPEQIRTITDPIGWIAPAEVTQGQ